MKTKTPELDKQLAVQDKSQPIGEFLDWLTSRKGYTVCFYKGGESWREFLPVNKTTETLLAEFFDIDLKKCEQERQALLAEIQAEQS